MSCSGPYGDGNVVVVRVFFFSSRRRHTRLQGDWSSDVCSSDLYRSTAFFFWCLVAVSAAVVGLGVLVLGARPGKRRRDGGRWRGLLRGLALAAAGSEEGRVGKEGRSRWAPDP